MADNQIVITELEAFADGDAIEASLVERAKQRDPAVWAVWHDEHYATLYRYVYSRLRVQADAEDVASQVFLEAIKGIGRYSYRGKPILAWFYGIAQHLVSKRLRESARHSVLDAGSEAGPAVPAPDGEVLDRVWLASLLSKLKPEHREVLILRHVLELPAAEVAAILGKSEAATYSLQIRAARALARLAGGKEF